MVLKGNRQIIFIENLDPVSAEKVVWYQHDRFKALGVNLHLPTKNSALPAGSNPQIEVVPAATIPTAATVVGSAAA
jgi:hypothetical protein